MKCWAVKFYFGNKSRILQGKKANESHVEIKSHYVFKIFFFPQEKVVEGKMKL